ncbi:MAG: response regulator, partial [Longimicrobiales bacterium]|nr:response regulator [Longimicrobiales bacterium]
MPGDAPLRALLVEDDPGERWITAEILRSRGYAVTICETAEDGWDRYEEDPYPLVLMDWMLPGMDGLELCRKIRRHPQGDRTVVVVVTARDDPEDLEEVLRAGADDYVSKPIDVGLMHVRLTIAERDAEAIGHRKEAQMALEAKTRNLKRANQELESFAYTVSHDLRAPLRTMEGFAHVLLADFGDELSPEAKGYVRRIIDSGRTAEQLIQDLLDYSTLSLQEVTLEPVELSEVVERALEGLSADLEASDAEIRVEDPLPSARGHAPTLVQVVTNLLANAVKFVPETVTPVVVVRAESFGEHVRLWVEDNGMGIPPDKLDRIFRVFERLAESGDRPGTGIGLAIVRRGMERMGGSAGAESDG